jgi:hypothetical protein
MNLFNSALFAGLCFICQMGVCLAEVIEPSTIGVCFESRARTFNPEQPSFNCATQK